MNITYSSFTDIDMNTILIPEIPETYEVNPKISQFFIQGYSDGSFDIIVDRLKDKFTMQGCYFSGDRKAVCITGFRMKENVISIHFKLTKNSRSLASAKKAMRKMYSGLIQVKENKK